MAAGRPLRVLLFASNGGSTGHMVRVLAVARALRQLGVERDVPLRLLLATTSQAGRLLDWGAIPSLRLPCPTVTSEAGWSEPERLALLGQLLGGAVAGFAPDIFVADTFPAGPHFELRGIVPEVRRRVLLRRSIRADRLDEPEICAQLDDYQVAILVDDPTPQLPQALPSPAQRVAPVTLLEPSDCLSRQAARRALGVPRGRAALLTLGGGADAEARAAMRRAVPWLRRAGFASVVVAEGQLAHMAVDESAADATFSPASGALDRAVPGAGGSAGLSPIPLQRYLAAFDLAVTAGGYNTTHELAKQGVRQVLWAREREFDDQAARAQRFEHAGLGVALRAWSRNELLEAVERASALSRPRLALGGAAEAARIVLEGVA